MCRLCDEGKPQNHHFGSRRGFFKAAAATGAAATAFDLLAAGPAAARDDKDSKAPDDSGQHGRRYVIRGGAVMSMDPKVGDFAQADVLVEGRKIVAVGRSLHVGGAAEIDARGRIVMPGFIDTHHHLFETALRSFLADGILINDGSNTPSARPDLLRIHPAEVRAGLPPAGRLHQPAVRLAEPARCGRDDRARHLADPPLAAALGRRDQGRDGFGPAQRVRLLRERGRRDPRHQPGPQVPGRRDPHQEAVVLVERPADDDDHGRRALPAGLREGLEDRPRARPAGGGAHAVAVRHPPDLRRARAGQGRRQRHARPRPRQPVRAHDRHVRPGLAARARTPARTCRSRCRSR